MIANLAWALKFWPRILKMLITRWTICSPNIISMCFYFQFKAVFGFSYILRFFAKATFHQINNAAAFTALCLIKKVFLLKALWKVGQVLSCLQHRLIDWLPFPFVKFLYVQIFLLLKNLSPCVSFECQNWRFSKNLFQFRFSL